MPLIALIMSHTEGNIGTADMARTLGLNPDHTRKACSLLNVQARDGVEKTCVLDLKQLHVQEVLSRRISSCKS